MKRLIIILTLLMITACNGSNLHGGAGTYPPDNCIEYDDRIDFDQHSIILIQGVKTVEDVCVGDMLSH